MKAYKLSFYLNCALLHSPPALYTLLLTTNCTLIYLETTQTIISALCVELMHYFNYFSHLSVFEVL